ncbi:MAG TPA: HAD family phosphatase [Gemmatimonadales bacterium]|nr:HAD family phosphatase [Gemmatimonadales bacterium]
MSISHLFFDVGGVLGSNGWDREQRRRAVDRFGLEEADLEDRHAEAAPVWEEGRMTLEEYLGVTVFYRPRRFQAAEFIEFMLAQSTPDPACIALARTLAASGRFLLMTINNESAELNLYRIRSFGLKDLFAAFFSSCWVGALKPSRRIYEVALAVSQAEPHRAVFIDDRERNLETARALGMRTILYHDAAGLRTALAGVGVEP